MKSKIAEFFGWIAFLAWSIWGLCIALLPYVGVYISYVCIPTGLISTLIWWSLTSEDKN